ncbi:hypothetical protein LOTGIDRAFT_178508 [Lottia gigantea]|uniref:Alpha-(1,6)-fucosyltransferase n=1 Tax=Lottia gigantea TaxID=225164 RepID=V4A9S3_LOTGI|nr:hypothetical protein LOTGIDRAFT_178508 [Lottia gigantea]ESO93492.1 hypothetical protein LOTGIDRAFT_178508 [Lottia gigantea]
MDKLKSQNDELQKLAVDLNACDLSGGPSLNHERSRRKVENTNREFWYFIKSELNKLKQLAEETLRNIDGNDEWRLKELQDLGDLVFKRLDYLQNPKDCSTAKKIVCNLHKGCGYGCQLHHVTYCLIVAYATQRTLILESKGWRYASQGWETVYLPLSNTCTDRSGSSIKHWGAPSVIENIQVVELPIVDSMNPRPLFMPLSVPADLAERLSRVHGDPSVWWIGQMVRYLTRPQPELADDLKRTKHRLEFKSPIVGVHVRRTDKVGVEAAFHSIDEYMIHVQEYFDKREMIEPISQRRVYLATDEPSLLTEAREKYPTYIFISDNEISKSAALGTRYTDASLRGVIVDIHFLSLSDYLVCTFSSQVCRVAYEVMQTLRSDAANNFYSLDDVYYFGGQNAHNMVALENYKAKHSKEIDLEVGDLVGIAGNHWDGYSKGANRRSGRSGLYPSYKVENKVMVAEMPTYPEADKAS